MIELSLFEFEDDGLCLIRSGGSRAYLIDPGVKSTWVSIADTVRLIEDEQGTDPTTYPYQGIRRVTDYAEFLPRHATVKCTLSVTMTEDRTITATFGFGRSAGSVGEAVHTLLSNVPLPQEPQGQEVSQEALVHYKASVIFPGRLTGKRGQTIQEVEPFEGTITEVMIWDHHGQSAHVVWFTSSQRGLHLKLHEALLAGTVWNYQLELDAPIEQERNEEEQ